MMDNKKYKTSITISGQKIIPSDTFETKHNKYVLLDILENDQEQTLLKIMGIKGGYISKTVMIDLDIFSNNLVR